MNLFRIIAVVMMMGLSVPLSASGQEDKVDVVHMLFGHIGDSYGWHITEWNGKHVTIPLPCIVRSSSGWHVFMSSKIEHGHMPSRAAVHDARKRNDDMSSVPLG